MLPGGATQHPLCIVIDGRKELMAASPTGLLDNHLIEDTHPSQPERTARSGRPGAQRTARQEDFQRTGRDSPCPLSRSNAATIFRWMKRTSPRLASERAYIICGFPVTATIRPNAWRSRAGSRRQPVNFVPAQLGMKLGCLVWTFGALPASPARRMTCEPAGARPARPGWRTAEPTSVASTLRPI